MGLLSKLSIGALDLPVGPQADVRELEYICALLQTNLPGVRDDATISATDIRLYLRSRYGLSVTPEVAIDIVHGLGGGDDARRRRRRQMHHRHQKNDNDAEGGDLLVCDAEANDVPAQEDVEDSNESGDDTVPNRSEQLEADEEMGLFESAITGDIWKGTFTSTVNRQPSIFYDAMESATNFGDDFDTASGNDQENQEEIVPNASSCGISTALQVNTDLEQSIKTRGGSMSEFAESPPQIPLSKTDASDNREVYLDPVQVLGALLIPTIIKLKREAFIANGIINDDPPIPANPELSFQLLLDQPRQFLANRNESKKLERRRKERDELNSLRPTPRRLIRDVLIMLIHHVDESNPLPIIRRAQESKDVRERSPANKTPHLRRVVINEDFVRDLLLSFGEMEAADDDELVREMMIVAGGEGAVLDELAFSRALTSDVLAWTCGMEDGEGETFSDVWGFDPVAKNEYDLARSVLNMGADVVVDAADLAIAAGMTAANAATEVVQVIKPAAESQDSSNMRRGGAPVQAATGPDKEKKQSQEDQVQFVHTAHYIDYVSDSFRSLLFQMALYVFYLFSAFIGKKKIVLIFLDDPRFVCKAGRICCASRGFKLSHFDNVNVLSTFSFTIV